MKRYLFDTNAISLWFDNSLPEKWLRQWKEIKIGNSTLLLFEQLISEAYYKNIQKYGNKKSRDNIFFLKSFPNSYIYKIKDKDALSAGDIKVKNNKYKLSLVDCFLIAIARTNRAEIFTTDPSIRDVAKKMKISVNYFPLKKS